MRWRLDWELVRVSEVCFFFILEGLIGIIFVGLIVKVVYEGEREKVGA